MNVEYALQSFPLPRELNAFDQSALYPQAIPQLTIPPTRTPLSRIFWPYLKFEPHSAAPRSSTVDEHSHLVSLNR